MKNCNFSKEEILTVLELHRQGLTNRQIGKQIDRHWNSVGDHLKKKGLISNGRKMQPINIIGENLAICSKCKETRPLSEFQRGRVDKQYEYHFSFCNECRKRQSYLNLNNNIRAFLSNSYHKLKLRSKRDSIPFDLTKEQFIEIYDSQDGLCFYTQEKLDCTVGRGLSRTSLSVDKIVSERGYVFGNIVLCSVRANTMKNDLTIEELKKWIPLFYYKLRCKFYV